MELTVPDRITGHAREAWESIASSLPAERNLSRAELLNLEAACRAFARWRSLEDAIEDLRRKQPLAAELTRSAKGDLQPSAIRQAASEAFAEYDRLISGLDLGARRSAAPGFDLDLFGDPVRVPGRRGRPQHVASQRNRDKVVMLLALGWSNDRIANALVVSLPTLRPSLRR